MTITKEDVKELGQMVLGIGVVLLLIGGLIYIGWDEGKKANTKSFQTEAITNGAAYWAINPTNGETAFTWKK